MSVMACASEHTSRCKPGRARDLSLPNGQMFLLYSSFLNHFNNLKRIIERTGDRIVMLCDAQRIPRYHQMVVGALCSACNGQCMCCLGCAVTLRDGPDVLLVCRPASRCTSLVLYRHVAGQVLGNHMRPSGPSEYQTH